MALALLGCTLGPGCSRSPGTTEGATLSWSVSPAPPRVGPAVIALQLTDARSRPISRARWRIQGLMTHPGMRPVEAQVTEGSEGRYEARLSFSMAGDWVLVARADWPEHGTLERRLPLRVGP